MFELVRAKITFSYDFMSAVQHRLLHAPEEIKDLGTQWGITLTGTDFTNAVAIIERKYNEPKIEDMSNLGRMFLKLITALEQSGDVSDYPIVAVSIAKAFLVREEQVKAAYVWMMVLIADYCNPPEETPEVIYAMLNTELDGIHAVDDKTKALVAVVREFGYSASGDPLDLDVRRALIDFPALATVPWFWHPDKPSALGVVTDAGLVWLNGLPIECRPWSVFSHQTFNAVVSKGESLQIQLVRNS